MLFRGVWGPLHLGAPKASFPLPAPSLPVSDVPLRRSDGRFSSPALPCPTGQGSEEVGMKVGNTPLRVPQDETSGRRGRRVDPPR